MDNAKGMKNCEASEGKASSSPLKSELKPRSDNLAHTLRGRPLLRKFLAISWILLWAGVLIGMVEVFSYYWLVPWHQELGNRQMQPYLMSGGFLEAPRKSAGRSTLFVNPSGPEAYGYYQNGDIRVFGFEQEISSIAERGDFLFQDRVELANDTKRSDVLRVFVLGGSAAYGVGASSNENRWYLVLERALSIGLAREVRLIPSAMIGYVSTQERLVLDWVVLPRRPDAVVILDGFNDAALPAVFGTRPGDPYDQGLLYAEFYSPFFGLKKAFAKHSHFGRYLFYRSMSRAIAENERRILENPRLLANYARSTASVYLDNTRHMLGRCKDQGVPGLVFLQPVRVLTSKFHGTEENLDPFVTRSYEEILKNIRGLDPAYSIHDLTTVFNTPGQEKWFMDSVHFEDSGHRAVADAMYPILLDALRERTGKSQRIDHY